MGASPGFLNCRRATIEVSDSHDVPSAITALPGITCFENAAIALRLRP